MWRNVAIIIPVYNEAKVIAGVIKSVQKEFPNVVCVDDGSQDSSAAEILKTEAHLIRHPINMGQGAALQTGIEYARTNLSVDYFVTFDADGQHRIEDVKEMLRVIQEKKVDIVLGSRFLGTSVGMPRLKRLVLMAAIKFSNVTSGVRLTDTHNGLRVFNRTVAEVMQITMSDFAHASEIVEIIRENKFKYAETPVRIVYTDHSKAKGQPILNAVNIAFDVLLRRFSR